MTEINVCNNFLIYKFLVVVYVCGMTNSIFGFGWVHRREHRSHVCVCVLYWIVRFDYNNNGFRATSCTYCVVHLGGFYILIYCRRMFEPDEHTHDTRPYLMPAETINGTRSNLVQLQNDIMKINARCLHITFTRSHTHSTTHSTS